MQEFKRATFHKEFIDEENNSASFVFEPLERGFGTTVGNAVCRVLMTNLPGTGVVGFEIAGTDPDAVVSNGILEDMTGIMLNVKALQFTSDLDESERFTLRRSAQPSLRPLISSALKKLIFWIRIKSFVLLKKMQSWIWTYILQTESDSRALLKTGKNSAFLKA